MAKVDIELEDNIYEIKQVERERNDLLDDIRSIETKLFGLYTVAVPNIIGFDKSEMDTASLRLNELHEDFTDMLSEYKQLLNKAHEYSLVIDEYLYGSGEIVKEFDILKEEHDKEEAESVLRDKIRKTLKLDGYNFQSYDIIDYLVDHRELLDQYMQNPDTFTKEAHDDILNRRKLELDKILNRQLQDKNDEE